MSAKKLLTSQIISYVFGNYIIKGYLHAKFQVSSTFLSKKTWGVKFTLLSSFQRTNVQKKAHEQ